MTRPAHTVKHMHSSFNNYQIIALVCALLTITACLLAAVSGLRVNTLIEQSEKKAATASTVPDPAVAQELERTQQFLKGIQEQLKAERERSEKLKERVVELERSKAGSKIESPAKKPVAAMPTAGNPWQPLTALPSSATEKEDLTPVTSSP
ncbi:MAG: hypothetical protein VR64_16355 [Desulfatitalea sp. BRH_c12]|nr:MAG: hypothetical protein VR64_16355 [Desulfatitalea sp. BRH_c12]